MPKTEQKAPKPAEFLSIQPHCPASTSTVPSAAIIASASCSSSKAFSSASNSTLRADAVAASSLIACQEGSKYGDQQKLGGGGGEQCMMP